MSLSLLLNALLPSKEFWWSTEHPPVSHLWPLYRRLRSTEAKINSKSSCVYTWQTPVLVIDQFYITSHSVCVCTHDRHPSWLLLGFTLLIIVYVIAQFYITRRTESEKTHAQENKDILCSISLLEPSKFHWRWLHLSQQRERLQAREPDKQHRTTDPSRTLLTLGKEPCHHYHTNHNTCHPGSSVGSTKMSLLLRAPTPTTLTGLAGGLFCGTCVVVCMHKGTRYNVWFLHPNRIYGYQVGNSNLSLSSWLIR